ncbi:hypothetical protein L6R53_23510 [Myxococcota bacterium]|nr:hypothetical protein [Myxococcota bacterium]
MRSSDPAPAAQENRAGLLPGRPEGPPASPRPLRAAAVGLAALLVVGAPLTGPLSTYALGLPLLALCATWLAGATGEKSPVLARLAAGALLLAPAAGLRATRVGIDTFEVAFVPAEGVIHHLLQASAATSAGVATLLWAGGLAGATGLGRASLPATGAALGGAAGAGLAAWALRAAAHAWEAGQAEAASRWAHASSGAGLLAVAGGLAGLYLARSAAPAPAPPRELRRAPTLLAVLVLLTAGWLSTPTHPVLASALPPAPPPDVAVQALPSGRAFAAPLLRAEDLSDPARLDALLAARRLHPLGPEWPCSPLPPLDWADDLRNVALLAVDPQTPLSQVEPGLERLVAWGVYEVVLLGRAPPQPGAVGAHARWPGVSLLLDRPPEGVRWLAADARGWQVVEEAPWFGEASAACALVVPRELTVGALTLLARDLSEPGGGRPCQDALALVLPTWEEATAGQAAPPGCAATPPRRAAAPPW